MSGFTIELRPLKAADAPALALLANNKKIWDNVRDRMPYPYAVSDAEQFIELASKENGPCIRAVIYNGQLAGATGLHPGEDVYRGTAELGYWIGEPFWGRGIASTVVQQMIRFGFEELGLRRISAAVFEYNEASMRVLEKNGFVREGIAYSAIIKNNEVWDEIQYGLVAI